MANPYETLPATAFWRTAVAEPDAMDIAGLWDPKFEITTEMKAVTAGSCFAQHISRAMRENGFTWIDCEPAPPLLTPESARRFNYGVFSFRTGNIYTARLMRQWVQWAIGEVEPDPEVWEDDGRFLDPVRPQVEPGGFQSVDELMRARQVTLAAIRTALTQAELFVFTFGLTEGWRNARTGLVYPSCPGTLGGDFDPDVHELVNDAYPAVREAMADVIELAHRVNPRLRFLLTVSPVPITATASSSHVLKASTYTKSTLRAVAGDLAVTYDNVDYFPGYELIASAPYRARFYDSNMRTVSAAGVDHVMSHFLGGLEEVGASARAGASLPPQPQPQPQQPTATATDDEEDEGPDQDVICDEELLENFNPH